MIITSKDTCRISTLSQNGWPHSVPIGYVFLDDWFYVPAQSYSRKIRNLQRESKATIVIDDEETEHGIMIECNSTILEGRDAKPMKDYMTKVKRWQNNDETVIIRLEPLRKSSWFLK